MNFKIWKYSLSQHVKEGAFREEFAVPMPYEAQLLDAGFKDREACVWALHLIEHEKRLVDRRFLVIMTNEEAKLHYLWKHFKTIRSPTMDFVYHIFVYHE